MIFKIFVLTTIFKLNEAVIGYDCGSTTPNITTFSLLDSGECDFHNIPVNSTNVYIELIQVAEFRSITIRQCKIEIHRTVSSCGIFGHLIPTENGEQEYIYEISHEQCNLIHETGIFKYDNSHTIANLKVNSTTTKGIDFAGSAEGNSCSGASYADNFGSWNKVFVHGLIKITLTQNSAKVSLSNDKLRLSSGTVCKFSEKNCIDMEGGHTFWDILPQGECFKNSFDVLYKGTAIKYFSDANHEIVYTLNSNEITFALAIKDKIMRCNREFIRTEHPKLLIAEKNSYLNKYQFDNDIVSSRNSVNLDLFTYVNSKFVYVEKHLRNQLNNLYLNLISEKCEIERKIIQNSLSIATLSPDEFAYNIMKKPGYIARLAGEVVHLIKCVPKTVKILHLKECYNQLPVLSGNETWFLTPKTHILMRKGVQIDCNSIVPTYYKIGEEWIKFTPTPTKTLSPHILRPNTKIGWTFESVESLATSGIYSQEELDNLQQQLMFPMEKASLLNIIAREMAGDEQSEEIFSQNSLKRLAESTWNTIVQKFITCGSFSSVFIMLLIILHVGKLIIDAIIRGYTLHTIFGWSIHLFGAIFSSVTHLLTTLQNSNDGQTMHNNTRRRENYEETELREIKVIPTSRAPITPPPIPDRPPIIKQNKPKTSISTTLKTNGIFSLDLE